MRCISIVAILTICLKSYAQVLDVPRAFNSLKTTPQIVHWKNRHIKIPSGGHLQGIQALSDSQLIITSSSGSYSFYLLASINGNGCEIEAIRKISDPPFSHAGGFQVCGHDMLVGAEDNKGKDKSEIIQLSFEGSGQQRMARTIAHRSGSYKRSPAGAAGMTRITSGRYLVAVGDWDSRFIDFYLSHPGADTLFDSLTTFHVSRQQKWCSYQTLNLLTDSAGHIYMIGMGLDGLKNRADLFEVALLTDKADLKLLATKYFNCKGAGFRYSSGINVTHEHTLVIYANGMHVGPQTAINIFKQN